MSAGLLRCYRIRILPIAAAQRGDGERKRGLLLGEEGWGCDRGRDGRRVSGCSCSSEEHKARMLGREHHAFHPL